MKTTFLVYEPHGSKYGATVRVGEFATREEAVRFAADRHQDAWWSGSAAWMTESESVEGNIGEAVFEIREIVDMEGQP